MEKNKFPKWPIWDEEEINAVTRVIESGQWWSGAPKTHAGEEVWKFNQEFANFNHSRYAYACTNGTHAIEIALRALNIGLGDEVIVSVWTFLASAAAVVAVNAVPIFCDIDPHTFLLDPDQIERLITPKTKAIICVHLGGMPCEMDRIMDIARAHKLSVIEDCAHAHGSKYKGKMVGNWGDCGTFSFQASKVITAGEGGAIVCNNEELSGRIYSVLDSGRIPGRWFYDHFTYGSDFRLGELNAAILRTQLRKYPPQLYKRNENATYLTQQLQKIPGVHPQRRSNDVESCGQYVYPVFFDPSHFGGMGYEQMYAVLARYGIPTDACYPPLYALDCFKNVDLLPKIDYSSANWGGEKSDPSHYPIVSKIHRNAFQLDHTVFLAEQSALDFIVAAIREIQTANSRS